MLHAALLLKVTLLNLCIATSDYDDEKGGLGDDLVRTLKQNKNLDLSVDEEYEDLRAELLAYHTVLKKIKTESGRRSLITTPCWQLGGICIDTILCSNGAKYLTEVPGCKDKLKVCCFEWNRYIVRDQREHGIMSLSYPWGGLEQTFGGKGVVDPDEKQNKKMKKSSKLTMVPAWVKKQDKKGKAGTNQDDDTNQNQNPPLNGTSNGNDDVVKIKNDTDIVAVVIRSK